jgi:hypothetical protein
MLTTLLIFTATFALIDSGKPLEFRLSDPAYSRAKHIRSWVTLCLGSNENTGTNNQQTAAMLYFVNNFHIVCLPVGQLAKEGSPVEQVSEAPWRVYPQCQTSLIKRTV